MKIRQLVFRASVMLSLVAWHHLPRPQVARCGRRQFLRLKRKADGHLRDLDQEHPIQSHIGRDYHLTDVHGEVVKEILA